MKKSLLAAAVFCAFSGSVAAQEAARISRVTLYPGSATVERSAKVEQGGGKVVMSGLPANFDSRTLRVEAGPGIRVGEVVVLDSGRSEALGGREAQLEARIEALKDEKSALDVDVKTAEMLRNYLTNIVSNVRPPPQGDKPQPIVIDHKAIPAVLEAIRKGATDSFGVMQRIELRKRGIDRQVATLERDLGRLRSGARDVRTVSIAYSASKPGELRAVYQVPNAGWKPGYRAYLDSTSSKVELERVATVQQRTGEDWRGVSLRLATGQPRSAQIVDPSPWQIGLQPPVEAYAAGQLQDNARGVRATVAERRKDGPAAPAPIVAQFHTEYATEFEVPGRVDLAADGREVGVSLTKDSVAAKQRIRVMPRGDASAMVTAEGELPEGVWIPGDVQLYRDGSYVGSTFWQAQAKEKMVLPFGRDDRVTVAVKRVKNRTGTAGFVGMRNERQVSDLYTITSRHKVAVDLLLLEASPVAANDQIKIEAVFEPKPKTLNWEDRRGVVAWEQPLRPGETLKFVTDYTITYPKDTPIAGLP